MQSTTGSSLQTPVAVAGSNPAASANLTGLPH